MSNSNNFDPEIFLKGKLEEQLNVSIRHNTKGNDPPDLEFESNGKQIGIEVTRVIKKMDDDASILWLKDHLAKTIKPCLEAFEKKYAHDIRNDGETRCFVFRVTWGDFRKRVDASTETFNAIRDSIQKTIIQGLKVLFRLPEVKNEMFFSDKTNLLQLNEFWAGNFPGAPIDGGFVTKYSNWSWEIKIKKGFYLDILCGPYKETISVPDDKLFDNSPLLGIDEGAVIVGEEFAPLYGYIQEAIHAKKKKCMSLDDKSGQQKDEKYDEMWLYLYDEINPSLFQLKREQVKAMPFNFENYWSKVCLFTSLCVPKWYISLSGDQG